MNVYSNTVSRGRIRAKILEELKAKNLDLYDDKTTKIDPANNDEILLGLIDT